VAYGSNFDARILTYLHTVTMLFLPLFVHDSGSAVVADFKQHSFLIINMKIIHNVCIQLLVRILNRGKE